MKIFKIIQPCTLPSSPFGQVGEPLCRVGVFIMEEIWKDIPLYNGRYQISNLGNVKSIKFNKNLFLKPRVSRSGYKYVNLNQKSKDIHVLVAKSFIDNVNECVNHIDGNKLNNSVSNLEWVSQRTNSHLYWSSIGYENHGIQKVGKKFQVRFSINGKKIYAGRFDTIDLAKEELKEIIKKYK